MARYNTRTTAPRVAKTPFKAEAVASGKTHEGAAGYERDARVELFLRAVSSFAGEDSFYEAGNIRDERMRDLVRHQAVTPEGWAWLNGFLPWLRTEGFMRTAPILLAAEAVQSRLQNGLAGGSRQLVDKILQRADEPGEFISYWVSRFGRNLPKPVKRGIADAVLRLYTERSLLKYDTPSHGYRFGDVLELVHVTGTHPSVKGTWKGDLYEHAIDRRHGRPNAIPASLKVVAANKAVKAGEVDLDDADLKAAGMTWEQTMSAAGSTADKAAMWERQIDADLGFMAMLRNLRNMDQAGISAAAVAKVIAKLTNPAEVARSKQFPYRFVSAYNELASVRYADALETALTLSTRNIPELPGRTLVLIDTSASMSSVGLSKNSKMTPVGAAALFGIATAARNPGRVDVYGFADGQFEHKVPKGASVLKTAEQFGRRVGEVGHGTAIEHAVNCTYKGHDRVMIFTDMQTFGPSRGWYGGGDVAASVPKNVPVYAWNLSAYTHSGMSGDGARYEIGGLNDATFRLIPLIEAGRDAKWPWEE